MGSSPRLRSRDQSITATALDGDQLKSSIGANTSIYDLFQAYNINPESVDVVFTPASGWGVWGTVLSSLLPLILFGLLLWFLLFRRRGARGAGDQVSNFGRSRAR